ncbi:mitochondrial PGP phosphatase [Tricharina praecox]|uniref:mitochondrial PGP phosphatase n=1 Tax=Tricharina praecox TaxID=43433 RepID=UPI00221EB2B1|nr:mitochondrial PGP phosphatase [Tricharina praecox]KAI5842295.1 mitochondrial PGP phosphatase [Tricharina praecox]
MPFNLSATVSVLRCLKNPALLYPQCTIATFDQLPYPLSSAFPGKPDIRAVVLDKDNCFATPYSLEVYPAYTKTFTRLRAEFPGDRLLIVSNSSGTSDDASHAEAAHLESALGVRVLRHSTKKPGCHGEILEFFRTSPDGIGITRADQIAVVGDRLCTDVLMANLMGSYAVWVRDGVRPAREKFYGKVESRIMQMLKRRGWAAPTPSSSPL